MSDHISEGHEHKVKALEAIEAANEGMADHPEVAQVYATTAVAEGMLSIYDILIDIRHEIERIPSKG
jgi:hypothetical protein